MTFLKTLTLLLFSSSISLHAISFIRTTIFADWFDGWRSQAYFTCFMDDSFRDICCKEIHPTHQGRHYFYFWGFVFIEAYIFCSCTKISWSWTPVLLEGWHRGQVRFQVQFPSWWRKENLAWEIRTAKNPELNATAAIHLEMDCFKLIWKNLFEDSDTPSSLMTDTNYLI